MHNNLSTEWNDVLKQTTSFLLKNITHAENGGHQNFTQHVPWVE